MVVVHAGRRSEAQIQKVIDRMVVMGFTRPSLDGRASTVLGGVGPKKTMDPVELELLDGVREVRRVSSPYKLAGRHFRPGGTVIKVGDIEIGGTEVVRWPARAAWRAATRSNARPKPVAAAGVRILRGGAFKPRSSPYSFQGIGEEGLRLLREAADRNGL